MGTSWLHNKSKLYAQIILQQIILYYSREQITNSVNPSNPRPSQAAVFCQITCNPHENSPQTHPLKTASNCHKKHKSLNTSHNTFPNLKHASRSTSDFRATVASGLHCSCAGASPVPLSRVASSRAWKRRNMIDIWWRKLSIKTEQTDRFIFAGDRSR